MTDGTGALVDGQTKWAYSLNSAAATANLVVTDAQGHTVYSGSGEKSAGLHAFTWNGKVLDMPGASSQSNTGARVVDLQKIKDTTIIVKATQVGGNPKIEIESTVVLLEDLDAQLRRRVRDTKKLVMLIDAASTNGVDVRSSEYGTLAQRPKLTVTYQ